MQIFNEHSPMWASLSKDFMFSKVHVNSVKRTKHMLLLITHSWCFRRKIKLPWRTSSSSAQFGERSQNVLKKEVLHLLNIQTHGQLAFTCLKDNNGFPCWTRLFESLTALCQLIYHAPLRIKKKHILENILRTMLKSECISI